MNPVAAAVYRASPVWCQNLMLTGFATLLERERYGGRYRDFQDLLTRSDRWSRDELLSYQNERLRAIVTHAYDSAGRLRVAAFAQPRNRIHTVDGSQLLQHRSPSR